MTTAHSSAWRCSASGNSVRQAAYPLPGALGLGAIQVAFNAAVPAVGQVAQQVGLYQVQVFLRHQRITLEEGAALPVDDGKTSC